MSRAAAKVEGDTGIITGDWREKNTVVADESIALIFTDPVYAADRISEYGELAQFASRVLRPGGSLVCYGGTGVLPEIFRLVEQHLDHVWTLAAMLMPQKPEQDPLP